MTEVQAGSMHGVLMRIPGSADNIDRAAPIKLDAYCRLECCCRGYKVP